MGLLFTEMGNTAAGTGLGVGVRSGVRFWMWYVRMLSLIDLRRDGKDVGYGFEVQRRPTDYRHRFGSHKYKDT